MDFRTKNIIRSFIGHLLPISSIGFSASGKLLFSASADWNLIVWDILNGSIYQRCTFNCPILHAEIHPTKE